MLSMHYSDTDINIDRLTLRQPQVFDYSSPAGKAEAPIHGKLIDASLGDGSTYEALPYCWVQTRYCLSYPLGRIFELPQRHNKPVPRARSIAMMRCSADALGGRDLHQSIG